MADRAFEQAKGQDVIGAGGKAALRGASHVAVLRRAQRDKIPPLRDRGPPLFIPGEIGERVGDDPCAIDRERLQNGHDDVGGERRDHDVRKQMVDVGQHSRGLALGRRHLAQLLDPAIRKTDPAVAPEGFDDIDVVVLQRKERVVVGRADMVSLEKSFGDNLPVRRKLLLGGRKEAPVRSEDVWQPCRRAVADVGSILRDKDHAVVFFALDRHEAVGGFVHAGKAVLVGNTAQLAVEAVSPGVVTAGQRLPAAGAINQLHAAMPAGVAESPNLAVAAANGNDRRQRGVARHVTAGVRQRRGGAERRRRFAEHLADLRSEPRLRQVVRDRLAPHPITEICGLAIDVIEEPFDHVRLVRQDASHDRSSRQHQVAAPP